MSNWLKYFRENPHFEGSLLFDEPLAKHTYFKIGASASLIAIPKSNSDLQILHQRVVEDKIPFFILGLGSNLLASDTPAKILFIKTTHLGLIIKEEDDLIRTGSGVSVASFLRKAASSGWDGFEFMSGIPGTIGGVVAMNGGTHLGEAANALESVTVFSLSEGHSRTIKGEELTFSYRKNHFLKYEDLVTEASWKKRVGDPKEIREKLDSLYRRRKETQPLDFPSCGSVFKNPEGTSLRAWEVIEKLGLRGHRIGNAQIAEKHPNWILNLGEAKASDVVALIKLVKTKAKSELGIEMQEEVRIL